MDTTKAPRRRQESDSSEYQPAQMPDMDLSIGSQIIHGDGMPNIAGDIGHEQAYKDALAFNEEAITLLIADTGSQSEYPETFVQCSVNGKPAEVMINGGWQPIGWLPIGVEFITRRKYVEVLARAKPETVRTEHDDATVKNPRNMLKRSTRQAYPMSILRDDNPRGREWFARITQGY